jgi:hypothetical protein
MKKIIKKSVYLIVIFFTILSCQNESVENQDSIEIIDAKINKFTQKLFYDNDFNKYKNAYFDFEVKINTTLNYSEINSLKSDLELYNWIENNIDKTNFISINNFKEEKNNCERLKNIFLEKFKEELVLLNKYDNFQLKFENELKRIAQIEPLERSARDCYNANVRCIGRAQRNAAVGLAASAVSAFFNPIVGVAGALATSLYLSNALEACSDAFDACMENQ